MPSGLKVHPNRQHMIYPVGCTIVIEDLQCKKQEFLSGHSDNISCIAISKSGKYVASGQITYMGFKVSARQRSVMVLQSNISIPTIVPNIIVVVVKKDSFIFLNTCSLV